MIFDHEAMHRDILVKLNKLHKDQSYLLRKLEVGKATMQRLAKGGNIQMKTFLKFAKWLGNDPNNYLKKI